VSLLLAGAALSMARVQFGLLTIFHFLFVPLTIGLAWLVAIMQTAWRRTGDEDWVRLARFFGTILLINFAIGVATGLVQEFQFGMNWSTYSRFVGDVFGAPLAMEGVFAFFLESTFLGLWIFGWKRLRPGVHLLTIWLVAVGVTISAYFILVANAWMQHPVGYRIDAATGRPHLDNVAALLLNTTAVYAFLHTMLAAFVTASFLMLGVACWHLRRGHDVSAFGKAARLSSVVALLSVVFVFLVGDSFMRQMLQRQPMKVAAAEAIFHTQKGPGLSLLAVGPPRENPGHTNVDLKIPHVFGVLATNSWNGTVQGIDDLQKAYVAKWGAGNYVPIVWVMYWSFRGMVYAWGLMLLVALAAVWLTWRGRIEESPRFHRVAVAAIGLPVLANTAGWIMTEMGRQPWVVYGLQLTRSAVSPTVATWTVALGLAAYLAAYAVLMTVDGWLIWRYARRLPESPRPEEERAESMPALSY
jgi:cytochrome bd ubiquinol oxidase subunit I